MSLIAQYPMGIFSASILVLTAVAKANTFLLILDLAILLAYAPVVFNRPLYWAKEAALFLSLVAGQTLGYWNVASSTTQGIPAILLLSAIEYGVVRGSIITSYVISRRFVANGWDIFVFPALWVTGWQLLSLWPLGRLLVWSPSPDIPGYEWMLSIFGPSGYDWIVAAWAVVFYQQITSWYMGRRDADMNGHLDSMAAKSYRDILARNASKILAGFLIILALPSLHINGAPSHNSLELSPSFTDGSIALTVGCVLPRPDEFKHTQFTLDDYIFESQHLTSSAPIILWPENAITFHNETERQQAFEKIRTLVTGSYVGVSFEESYQEGDIQHRRRGLAVISKWSPEPHLLYFKQHLVPLVESFPLTPSNEAPEIVTLPLRRPKWISKKDWAEVPEDSKEITVTAGICLDVAFPSLFTSLPARPSLILAPAYTWDETVAWSMWQQAGSRAGELGSRILWCDGGSRSYSGVRGGAIREPMQQGAGSWTRTILIENRLGKTIYGRFNWITVILSWALVGSGGLVKLISEDKLQMTFLRERWSKRRIGQGPGDAESPLLLDAAADEPQRDLLG